MIAAQFEGAKQIGRKDGFQRYLGFPQRVRDFHKIVEEVLLERRRVGAKLVRGKQWPAAAGPDEDDSAGDVLLFRSQSFERGNG